MNAEHTNGMLSLEDLERAVREGQVETVLAVFPDLYGRLVGKRIAARYFLDHVAEHGMHACDYLFTVDMEMDVVEGYEFANWKKGYGDVHCVPNWSTLRLATWLDRSALIVCDVYDESTHDLVAVAPRTMLKKQLGALAEMGYSAKGGSELEYYLFKDSYEEAHTKGYEDLQPFSAYIEDYHMFQGTKEEQINSTVRRHMESSGIPVESSKGEWGPGQHELNLRYAEVLEMADRQCIYKQAFKEIAWAQQIAVSFMAKWRSDLAGSSMHLHLSLWDREDRAVFGDETSDIFRHFLGGWMHHARTMAPFYAPYPNSYKRYVYQSWAPTRIAWSRDNRTAGFRIVGTGKSQRIESRLPGADANPYIAYAAAIAAGIDGIKNAIEPPPLFSGDSYQDDSAKSVPANLSEATDALERSDMFRQAFGNDVVDHYVHFFRTEQRKYDEAVTSWERARYFERG